jgi:hypothetical protein
LRGEANSRETDSSRTPITVSNNPGALVFRQHFYLWPIPGVPRQLHKPRVFFQNNVWIALLGRSIEKGIVTAWVNDRSGRLRPLTHNTRAICVPARCEMTEGEEATYKMASKS